MAVVHWAVGMALQAGEAGCLVGVGAQQHQPPPLEAPAALY